MPKNVPNLTGTGSPWTLTTVYETPECPADPCLEVTETAQYTNGQNEYQVNYAVENLGAEVQKFRATAGGDVELGFDDGGVALDEPGPPRGLGTQNQNVGQAAQMQESVAAPWDRWMEGEPYEIWRRVQKPLTSGLANTVDDTDKDKAVAVQWDDYEATGLAPAATANFTFFWRYKDWDALDVPSPPSQLVTGSDVTLTATAREHDNSLTDLDVDRLRWRITGSNPTPGSGYQPPATQTTQGHADFTWTGNVSGWDDLETFVDANGNGTRDLNEARDFTSVFWFDRVQIPSYDGFDYAGLDENGLMRQGRATIRTRGTTNLGESHDFEWWVTGANPVPPTGGQTQISGDEDVFWDAANPGVDTIHVRVDLNDDLDYADFGENRSREITWYERVFISPGSRTANVGTTQTFTTWAYDAFGSDVPDGTQLRYSVIGGGGAPDVASALTGPTAFGQVNIQLTGSTAGRDVLVVYHDLNGDGNHDTGEPRRQAPIDWIVPPDQRLVVSPSNDTQLRGEQVTLNVHLMDPTGAPESETIRWNRTGANPLAETSFATNGSGDASVNWTDNGTSTTTYDDAELYADYDGDGNWDSNEPYASSFIQWRRPVELSGNTTPYLGAQSTVSVTLRGANGNAYNGLFTWTQTGANSGSGGGSTSVNGTAFFQVSAANTGQDTITVSADALPGGAQETGQIVLQWRNQLSISNFNTTRAIGQTASVTPFLQNASNSSRVFNYSIEGAGPEIANSVTASSGGSVPPITWSRSSAGVDTVTVTTAGGFENTTQVQWLAPELTLRIAAGTNPDTAHASVGATATATATLLNPEDGSPVVDEVIRWTHSGSNGLAGKHGTDTDGSGEIAIEWTGTDTGSDCIDLWADFDHDGVEDGGEPSALKCIQFHPRIEANDTYDSPYQGASKTVVVTSRTDDYQTIAGQTLNWRITGANPGSGTKVTNGSGQVSHTWTGVNEGEDVLEVWQETGTPNGTPDPGEFVATTTVDWLPRLTIIPCCGSTVNLASTTTNTVTATLRQTSGSALGGASLRYVIEGTHPTSVPQATGATNSLGQVQVTFNGSVAGVDNVTLWHDADGDGTRDAGEPYDTHVITWQHSISVLPTTTTKYHGGGRSQAMTVKQTTGTTRKVCWTVTGANPSSGSLPAVANNTTVALTTVVGDNPGTDYVFAFVDLDNDCVRDSGEVASAGWIEWESLVALGNPTGNPTAGGTTNVTATLRQIATPTSFASGTTLTYRVDGANASPPADWGTPTNASGQATITVGGNEAGSSTLWVWEDLNADDDIDPGEPRASRSIFWDDPPVTLSLAPATFTRFEDNLHTVTATLAGNPGSNDGVTIHWSVSGANSASGTATTAGGGIATFSYTGAEAGDDTITAYAEVSGAGSQRDGYDPQNTASIHWDPLLEIAGGGGSNSTGGAQSVTVTLRDTGGNPLVDREVWFEITGANPTSGVQVQTRTLGTATLSRVAADDSGGLRTQRTNGSGQTTVTWTGYNPGTDTLDVYGDSDNNGVLDPTDARARTTVNWAGAAVAAPGAGAGGAVTSPTGGTSQVPPESDFDGLPTPPPPVTGRTVNIEPVSGRVLVKLPGSSRFINLVDAEQVPVGTIVDVTRGRVELTSTRDLKGGVQSADFYKGMFKIGQRKAAKPVTDLALFGGNFKVCPRVARRGSASAAAKKSKVVRRLWGKGRGQFRTKGRYAAAVLRGTTWETQDRCDGTLVRVTQGVVAVTDLVKKKTVVVRAKRKYFASASRRR